MRTIAISVFCLLLLGSTVSSGSAAASAKAQAEQQSLYKRLGDSMPLLP
jgi:hypothetical protein